MKWRTEVGRSENVRVNVDGMEFTAHAVIYQVIQSPEGPWNDQKQSFEVHIRGLGGQKVVAIGSLFPDSRLQTFVQVEEWFEEHKVT